MTENPSIPPLKALHSKEMLVASKLVLFERQTTDALQQSLLPGHSDCLKTRADGTIIDGHHRVHVLRLRGVDVDALPREIIEKEDMKP